MSTMFQRLGPFCLIDRQGVSTSFSDGLCEMKDRAMGKVVVHCKI